MAKLNASAGISHDTLWVALEELRRSLDAFHKFQNIDEDDRVSLAPYVILIWNQKKSEYDLRVNCVLLASAVRVTNHNKMKLIKILW